MHSCMCMHWNRESLRASPALRVAEANAPTTWGKILASAEAVGDIAASLLMTRGRLRPLDYFALGLKATQAGMKLKNIWVEMEAPNLFRFFADRPEWLLCPYFASATAFGGLDIDAKPVDDFVVSHDGKIVSAVWTASVHGVDIAWVGPPNQDNVPDYIYSRTPERIREVAALRLWEQAGSDRIVRIKSENVIPHLLSATVIDTAFLRTFEMRVRSFVDRSIPRAMMLDGEPGMGKTTAAAVIARRLGLRACIVNASDLFDITRFRDGSSTTAFSTAEMLRPDVLIVNDVERAPASYQLQLLDAFDNAKGFAKLIVATTNDYRSLLEPVRRPGRLDDLIRVPGLSLEEIRHVAPSMHRIATKMIGWPVAYVRDMEERYQALGEAAFDELPEVQFRLDEVRADSAARAAKRAGKVLHFNQHGLPFEDGPDVDDLINDLVL